MQFPDTFYDSAELKLMTDALNAAWITQRSHHEPDEHRLRAAMAIQIMTEVSRGERDPDRLKLAALDTVNSRSRRYEEDF
jgi:hypothetical protein